VAEQYLYSEITGKIIGCAMKVHAALGNGFQEIIYQRSLAIELHDAGLDYARELEMPLFYKGNEVGLRRVDFLVEQKILVELKAVSEITLIHHAQIINYLNAYKLEIGLLINFGEKSLNYKRFIKSDKSSNL
jgi:GxxExxY protein